MSDIMNFQYHNPMQTFLQMSQFGAGLQQQREQGVTARINAMMLEKKLAAEQAAARSAAIQQEKIDELMGRLRKPGATRNDYLALAMFLPKDQAKAIQDSVAGMREEEQAAALNESAQIFSAFKGGRPDLAAQMIRRQAEAERASGNEQGASLAEEWAKMIDSGEDGAKAVEAMFGFQIAQMPGGDKAIEGAIKLEEERRTAIQFPVLQQQKGAELRKANSEAEKAAIEAKYAEEIKKLDIEKTGVDMGLTRAQTEKALADAKKLDADTQKLIIENTAAKLRGDALNPEKVFQMEKQLRDEYVKRTGQFTELRGTFDTIKASAADGSGAGDVALVTGFMKMLDPGSVVRETEFANARDTAGLFGMLTATAKKLKDGQFLTPGQRASFANLAAKYMEATSKYEKEIRSDLTGVVKAWALSEDNVFGASRGQPGFGNVQAPQRVEEVDY